MRDHLLKNNVVINQFKYFINNNGKLEREPTTKDHLPDLD